MKNINILLVSIISISLISSCTPQAKTSEVAAATGGALGAAIGAMVGNQTGSTAGGLLIGGAAGAGTGLAIGKSLEGQEREIANQREALARQNQKISAQQAELEELKRLSSDKISYRNNSYNNNQQGSLGSDQDPYRERNVSQNRINQDRARLNRNNLTYREKPTYESGELARSIKANVEKSYDIGVENEVEDLKSMSPQERVRRLRAKAYSKDSYKDNNVNVIAPKLPAYQEEDIVVNRVKKERVITKKLDPIDSSKKVESRVLYDLESNSKKINKNGDIVISNITETKEEARGALRPNTKITKTKETSIKKEIIIEESELTEECGEAKTEYSSALASNQIADKLYHYRRALRLCPDHAGYHTGLGKVYLSLNRFEDAKYEFQQALIIDPNFKPAKEQLASIK